MQQISPYAEYRSELTTIATRSHPKHDSCVRKKFAVIDEYSAMTFDRPIHDGMTQTEAVVELRPCAGTQFDHRLVRGFIGMVETCGSH